MNLFTSAFDLPTLTLLENSVLQLSLRIEIRCLRFSFSKGTPPLADIRSDRIKLTTSFRALSRSSDILKKRRKKFQFDRSNWQRFRRHLKQVGNFEAV